MNCLSGKLVEMTEKYTAIEILDEYINKKNEGLNGNQITKFRNENINPFKFIYLVILIVCLIKLIILKMLKQIQYFLK